MFWGHILNETGDRGIKMLRCEELLSLGHSFALDSMESQCQCGNMTMINGILEQQGVPMSTPCLDKTQIKQTWDQHGKSTSGHDELQPSWLPRRQPLYSWIPIHPQKNTVGFDTSKYSEFRLTVAMRKQNSLIHSSMGLSEKRVSVPPKFHGWYSSFLLFAGQHLGGILTRYFPAHCPHGALPSMPVFLGPGLNTCKDHHHLLDHCHPKDPFGWNLLNPHGDASNILWKIPIWMGFVQKVIQNGRYWVRWYPMDPDGPIAAWFLMCFHRFPAILTTFSNVATPLI